jgi:DNA repair protein RadA/Sms
MSTARQPSRRSRLIFEGISQTEIRVKEAARMGFTRCILPRTQNREGRQQQGIELIPIGSLKELTEHLF